MENQSTNNQHFRLLIIIVFVVFAGLLSFLVISKLKSQPKFFGGIQSEVEVSPVPTIQPTGGSYTISVVGDQRHPITDYLTLELTADSNGIDVVGYDVLLFFDPVAFGLIQTDSLLTDFQIFKNLPEGSGKLSITGAKKLGATTTNVWSGEKIVKFVLKPLKPGRFRFEIIDQAGKEKSQLVDSQTKVYYPQTSQLEVEIY